MKVRAMSESDIPAVAACHAQAWKVAYRGILSDGLLDVLGAADFESSWLVHATKSGRLNLVANGHDGIVGFIAVEIDPPAHGDAGEVIGVYVHPAHWRSGTGRQLLAAGLSRMTAAGYGSAYLWTMEANESSRAFYEAVGFSYGEQTRVSEVRGETFHEVMYSCGLTSEEQAIDPPAGASRRR